MAARPLDFDKLMGSDCHQIPPHGRWRHMDTHHGRIEPLVAKWASHSSPPDKKEAAKRLIDLFMVSVLLDAGAGNQWVYTEASSGVQFSRSEGLGVAAVHMFEDGLFSSDPQQPYRVDGASAFRGCSASQLNLFNTNLPIMLLQPKVFPA